jgi:ABC-type Co2+ transport system permease subunit
VAEVEVEVLAAVLHVVHSASLPLPLPAFVHHVFTTVVPWIIQEHKKGANNTTK